VYGLEGMQLVFTPETTPKATLTFLLRNRHYDYVLSIEEIEKIEEKITGKPGKIFELQYHKI
jgi:hypothetical protein